MVLLSRGEGEEVVSFGWDGFGFDAGCFSEGRFLLLGFLGFGRGGIFLFLLSVLVVIVVVVVVMLNFLVAARETTTDKRCNLLLDYTPTAPGEFRLFYHGNRDYSWI